MQHQRECHRYKLFETFYCLLLNQVYSNKKVEILVCCQCILLVSEKSKSFINRAHS